MAKSHLVIAMIDLIKNQPGITITELADHFGKSERSMYRWLREISSDLRLPVQSQNGGYYLPDDDSRVVSFTPQELLVLRLGLKSRLFAPGTPLRDHAESAWEKIRDGALPHCLESAAALAGGHSVGLSAPPFEADPDVARAIERAVVESRRMRAVYRSQRSDEVKSYVIDPYALVFRRHSWYVIGYCHEHEKISQFRLGRFRSAAVTGERFEAPSDFSVDDYFRWSWEAWGGGEPTRVVVRFDSSVAEMIAETQRHPSQVVHMEPDGSAVFEATVSSIAEFGTWVLGYGRHATVIEPEGLREYVLEHGRGILANHKTEQSRPG